MSFERVKSKLFFLILHPSEVDINSCFYRCCAVESFHPVHEVFAQLLLSARDTLKYSTLLLHDRA